MLSAGALAAAAAGAPLCRGHAGEDGGASPAAAAVSPGLEACVLAPALCAPALLWLLWLPVLRRTSSAAMLQTHKAWGLLYFFR